MMYQSKSKAGGRLRALALVPAVAIAVAVVNIPAVASVIADASAARVSHSDNKVKDNDGQIKIMDEVRVVGYAGGKADEGNKSDSALENAEIYINGRKASRQELNSLLPESIKSIDVDKGRSVIAVTLKKGGGETADKGSRKHGNETNLAGKVQSVAKSGAGDAKSNNGLSSEPVKAAEEMPRFPGGEAEMMRFLAYNIRYPEAAMKAGKSGLVVVRFVVSKTGKVESPEIIRSVSPELDEEALRVVGQLPDFIPGRSDGKAVACHYALPVSFALTGGDEKTEQTDGKK